MFCILPFGTHTIHVIDFKKDGIYTNESNTFVPVWNHRIELKDNGNGTTEYSDEVEICAGWKTFFVWMWAKSFYSHRQKKWIRLLKKYNSVWLVFRDRESIKLELRRINFWFQIIYPKM